MFVYISIEILQGLCEPQEHFMCIRKCYKLYKVKFQFQIACFLGYKMSSLTFGPEWYVALYSCLV